MFIKKSFVVLSLFAAVSCGSVSNQSLGESDPSISGETGAEAIFLFGTDYISSGQLFNADLTTLTLSNTGVTGLGSSASIKVADGFVYVLHDQYSSASHDNVQMLDANDGLSTVAQYSTGVSTNPNDIVIVGTLAYISLYNPELNPERVDTNGKPADVIVMNLDTGEIVQSISFYDYLNDDGKRTARAGRMERAGDKIYVCLQDLDGDFFEHNASGKIGVINLESNTIEEVFVLKGRNPIDLSVTADGGTVSVALQAPYDYVLGNFDTSLPYGGVEILNTLTGESTLVADETLGGYVEKVLGFENGIFGVVSNFNPTTFQFTSKILFATSPETISTFVDDSADVRDLAVDSKSRLWIARRVIRSVDGSASDPHVDVLDAHTGDLILQGLDTPVPIVSIAVGTL